MIIILISLILSQGLLVVNVPEWGSRARFEMFSPLGVHTALNNFILGNSRIGSSNDALAIKHSKENTLLYLIHAFKTLF